jgi:hypothetical protein
MVKWCEMQLIGNTESKTVLWKSWRTGCGRPRPPSRRRDRPKSGFTSDGQSGGRRSPMYWRSGRQLPPACGSASRALRAPDRPMAIPCRTCRKTCSLYQQAWDRDPVGCTHSCPRWVAVDLARCVGILSAFTDFARVEWLGNGLCLRGSTGISGGGFRLS